MNFVFAICYIHNLKSLQFSLAKSQY